MSMFRKAICGKTISPSCAYCLFSRPGKDADVVLCKKRGVVPASFHCHAYQYDPLMRIPKRQPSLPDFDAKDFSLDD